MWGGYDDTSKFQQTIWPRAAAAAGILATKYIVYFIFMDAHLELRQMVENFYFNLKSFYTLVFSFTLQFLFP